MSRRKQAKPRTFLKLGEAAAVGPDEIESMNLIDPKEELLSEVDTDDEDDRLKGDQEDNSSNDKSSAHNNHLQQEKNRFRLGSDVGNIAGELPSSLCREKSLTQSLHLQITDGDIEEQRLKLVLDDCEDVDDEDDEALSIESFYSDLYSTHTSSSYSPSISEGTLTPNSILHHHHQQQQQHQQFAHHHLPPPHQYRCDTSSNHHHRHSIRNHRNRRLSSSAINGAASGADDDDDEINDDEDEEEEIIDAVHSGGEDRVSLATAATKTRSSPLATDGGGGTAAATKNDDDIADGRERHRMRRDDASNLSSGNSHSMKIPSKLRKIDRDLAKLKDKLTSDGTKSTAAVTTTTTTTTTTTADGSYQCQFCDKSFPRLGYLKKHEQSHAEHLPFKCDYCARLFKHKRSRDRHTKLHTGDRRYRCPHCEAAFSRSDHLKIHMKTHDNQKPFQCTICNRGYNTAAALTSHMQNHKKQAALLAAGGNLQALNYSPRSTGSGSSNGSLHKRRYGMAASADSSPNRILGFAKRVRGTFMSCIYCTKSDFPTVDKLNSHIQTMHEKEVTTGSGSHAATPTNPDCPSNVFQLSCEYCTMKFPNIPTMFQHMRTTHIDRLTSPNSYFDHFNRLAASGTFSPRLANTSQRPIDGEGVKIKVEDGCKSVVEMKEEEPTDLSQSKRRSQTPAAVQESLSPQAAGEKPVVFFCNQCNAGLPDFENFRNHLKTHITQAISLVCHHCGLTLREQIDYERHVISHFLITNSEFSCSASGCNNVFTKSEELQKHLIDCHVQTLLKCILCSEVFDTKVAIQMHFSSTHSDETKILRCSACIETFRSETEFNVHVKTRHQSSGNSSNNGSGSSSLQCMFCRIVCSSELEMHFHLAAHARQFRCPSCPETFHVEFLLDRHMQAHHGGGLPKENPDSHSTPINPIYMNALFAKTGALMYPAAQNNNNSILDYNMTFAANMNKNLFPPAAAAAAVAVAGGKFYNNLQVDTNTSGTGVTANVKHPNNFIYGLSQRYFDTSRTLIDIYNKHQNHNHHHHPQHQQQQDKSANYFHSQKPNVNLNSSQESPQKSSCKQNGFSCGMCERNDFRTEAEVHSHRKIVHNLKTGVSLRCAYCSGNFKSRNELEHHMKTCHNSTGKHKCLICDEIFPSPAILAEHKLQHSKVGQSGKCSHCSKTLNDVADFKNHTMEHHNAVEGHFPIQCICCRQTLHSDFEVGLHAKFHTKSSSSMPESVCALCLEAIPNAVDAKVCDKCCRKHKFNNRERFDSSHHPTGGAITPVRNFTDNNRCNLCKMVLPHAQKLQEHLVEHTFAGCEDRGFICYICSAVFTAPNGLLGHMSEHGLNARPYDCNLCSQKFYFRAELDHHLVDHEMNEQNLNRELKRSGELIDDNTLTIKTSQHSNLSQSHPAEVKKEIIEHRSRNEDVNDDDDEYIEVEKVAEQPVIGGNSAVPCGTANTEN